LTISWARHIEPQAIVRFAVTVAVGAYVTNRVMYAVITRSAVRDIVVEADALGFFTEARQGTLVEGRT